MKKNSPHFPFSSLVKNPMSQYLHVKEDKYRAIIENSIHAFFFAIPDGTILETNNAASVLFGYSIDEFKLIKRWHFIDHTDQYFLNALKERETKGFTVTEATGIKKSGERFPIEVSSTVFRDQTGQTRSSIMISDISVRKKAEAAMRLSNERYDLVVKATKDLVWDWDLVTGEIYRNGNNLAEVYGHESNDFIKTIKDWSEYIHPEDKKRIKEKITYYKNSKNETDFNFEYRFRRQDGTYVFINDKGYLIRNDKGKVIRMIGAAEDITERKKSALAIEESEQRYRMFLKQSTEGIWRIELTEAVNIHTPIEKLLECIYNNAVVAECNDTFAKMYGFDAAEEMTGAPLSKILPATNPVNQEYLLKFLTNGFKVQDEISYETDKDGNQLIFMNNMVGIIEGDYITRAWGTQRNITEQKKAERALASSENHLRAIVQTDPECIKLLSKEGIVLEMNPAGLEMIEAENADQVLGKNALNLVLPKYQPAFKQLLKDVFDGKKANLVFEIKGFRGRKLFMESHCVPLRNETNNIIALLAVTRDITESKNAQARLMASEEKYRYLFNNNPASIIIWETETFDIIEVNETATNLYGYSHEEFLRLKILDLRPEKDRANFIKLMNGGILNNSSMDAATWQHIKKDGTSVIMEITPYKIKYKGKQAILALATDITEKVQLENSLNEERQIRQQQITEAVITGQEKERTELGEELHDNINQILASTKLYIECALKSNEPRKDLIMESKSMLEKAMTEIRTLSKSLLPPSLGEIGLLPALQDLVENLKHVNELEFIVEWEATDENEICDKLKLTIFRIVQEQLNNVIKHAEAEKVIVSVNTKNDFLTVSIKDNGLGFNANLKKNGVGLRNISSRAEVNRGTVSIISQPGEGCELVVVFPLTENKIMR